MTQNTNNPNKIPREYTDGRGNSPLYPHPIIGKVVHNVDSLHNGRIRVILKRLNGSYPENITSNWSAPISYMSPFFGYTPNESSKNDYGSFAGNPHSYGMWATPPDLGTEVLCVFANGDPNFGYYIGCIPSAGLNQMVPAIGAADKVILNNQEAASYGGSPKLPVGEINNANDKQSFSGTLSDQPRPVHSYQAAIYNSQGLLRDPERGPIGSSAQRESPSRVFGISTPGRPIYAGGYTDSTIKDAINDSGVPDASLKVTGRVGGHTFVMDDGDVEGNDQLVRIRTALGHTILLNDAAQTLFIMHSNGQSYIELGKEGTIDMYSTNSVNIRTQGDLNLHADRDINMNAGRDLNIFGKNTHIESQENTTHFTGKAMNTTVLGTHTEHVGGSYSVLAGNDVGITSTLGSLYLKGGPMILMNSGICPTLPLPGKQLPRVQHSDTLYDSNVGYATAPKKLLSIVSRAPAHAPWDAANKGIDVQTNLNSGNAVASVPSPAVTQVNSTLPPAPANPTSASLVTTVPTTAQVTSSSSIDPATTSSMVSQMAVSVANGPAASAVQQTVAVVDTPNGKQAVIGSLGLTPQQLVTSGHLKPGADIAINTAINSGQSLEAAMTPNLFTGKDGVNSLQDLVKNTGTQTNIAASLLNQAKDTLVNKGIITGKESMSQTGGLIMSTAVAGLKPTLNYAGSAVKSLITGDTAGFSKNISAIGDSITGTINNVEDKISSTVTGLEDKISSTVNNLEDQVSNAYDNISSSIDDLMSGGLFASLNIEEKLNTSSVESFLKGLSDNTAGAFNQVISAFKAYEANVPISLAAANEGVQAEVAVSDVAPVVPTTYSQAETTLNKSNQVFMTSIAGVMDLSKNSAVSAGSSSTDINQLVTATGGSSTTTTTTTTPDSILGGVPGGLAGLNNIVSNGQNTVTDIPQVNSVNSVINNISGSITSSKNVISTVQNSVNKLESTGLVGIVTSNMNPSTVSKISSALGSLGLGGPFKTILPTVATGTNKTAAVVQAQTAKLLGDPKIPAPNFAGKQAQTASEVVANSKKLDQINVALSKQQSALDNWNTARTTYGESDSRTLTAQAAYKQATANVDSLVA